MYRGIEKTILSYGFRVKLDTVLQIITTAVFHNITKDVHELDPLPPEDMIKEVLNYLIAIGDAADVPGVNGNNANHFRDQVINDYFCALP